MNKQHLSSFVAVQGTLVPCIFMCFSINFQQALVAFLFVCYFPDEIACSSILRNELTQFASGAVLSLRKIEDKSYRQFFLCFDS